MQDTLRAKVIGSQSCGCVLASPSRGDEGGGVLEMSEVLWFSPKGRKLEGTGIIPDQLVTPTMFDLQRGVTRFGGGGQKPGEGGGAGIERNSRPKRLRASMRKRTRRPKALAEPIGEDCDADAGSGRRTGGHRLWRRLWRSSIACSIPALRGRLRFGAHDAAVGHTIEKRPHRI